MSNEQEQKVYEPLNEGDYLMALKSVEERKSKAGDAMVTAVYEVADGEAKGRLIYDNYMVEHSNADVPEFAKQRVSRFLNAVGVNGGFEELGNDYSQLEGYIGKPFIAGIAFSKPYKNKEGQLTIGNRIKSFKAR